MVRNKKSDVEICILAGGLSTRMGRDKARVRLGRRTLLGHIRQAASATGWPLRVIRKDVVERCGPLGGILTGLQKSRAEVVIFLSCDMPFIAASWLKKLVQEIHRRKAKAVFTQQDKFAGFPFVLTRKCLETVKAQRVKGEFSLQALAKMLQAGRIEVPSKEAWKFMNVNTPEALAEAKAFHLSQAR
ncbi:MAG: molybdenum cofactor guanylyltransferase [Verrucomicrobia bacterium]|jgi:molybdopterin-guanine dinucleotide biosynthesis protein A|nr:molybdenum cofactor guanylyltransferase [Verrucomicrobiota bacterium]